MIVFLQTRLELLFGTENIGLRYDVSLGFSSSLLKHPVDRNPIMPTAIPEGISTNAAESFHRSNKTPYTIWPAGWAHMVIVDVYAIIFPIKFPGVFC